MMVLVLRQGYSNGSASPISLLASDPQATWVLEYLSLEPYCNGPGELSLFATTRRAERRLILSGAVTRSKTRMWSPEDKMDALEQFEDRTLLIVDDDEPFLGRLARAMETRGFDVVTAGSVRDGVAAAKSMPPAFAVLDLRLADGSGLDIVSAVQEGHPESRIVMLTGYGNIATAVAAVKAGALDYLAKPADADAVEAALLSNGDGLPPPPENPMSADRVRWEHIQRVYEQCDRNVSETARRLNMHRRTLQRILSKRAPREAPPDEI